MDALTFSALVFVVYGSALCAYAYSKRGSMDIGRIFYINLIILYSLVVFVMSAFPYFAEDGGGLSFAPVYEIVAAKEAGQKHIVLRFLTSCLLYVPLGFLSNMHSKLKGEPAFLKTVLLALLISISAEFVQLILPFDRTCSINDMIFNFIGAMLGYGLFTLCYRGSRLRAFMKNILYR